MVLIIHTYDLIILTLVLIMATLTLIILTLDLFMSTSVLFYLTIDLFMITLVLIILTLVLFMSTMDLFMATMVLFMPFLTLPKPPSSIVKTPKVLFFYYFGLFTNFLNPQPHISNLRQRINTHSLNHFKLIIPNPGKLKVLLKQNLIIP